jgi:hypothetical protein
MPARARHVSPDEPHAHELREVVQLVERIQVLVGELEDLRRGEGGVPELHAKAQLLEQLRARLAITARRSAYDDAEAA